MSTKSRPVTVFLKIARYQVYITPLIDVFNVFLARSDNDNVHRQSFGSEEELRAFLKGVRGVCDLMDVVLEEQKIPETPSKRFDEATTQDDHDVPF